MKIRLSIELAKLIKIENLQTFGISKNDLEYDHRITINLANSSMEKVKKLKLVIEELKDKRKTQSILREIDMWISISENRETLIKKLPHFESALIKYLLTVEGHRVFVKYYIDSEIWLCYRVVNIKYEPATMYSPASVKVKMVSERLGEHVETSATFHKDDVVDKTIYEILASTGIYAENKNLRESYLKQTERFNKVFPMIGKQFLVNGIGTDDVLDKDDEEEEEESNYRRHSWDIRRFEFENNKAVIDIFTESDSDTRKGEKEFNTGELFWENPFRNKDDDDDWEEEEKDQKAESENEEENIIEIPIHPFLTIFDLQRHLRLCVHVNYLTEYMYDKKMSDKLVLSEQNKNLIHVLIEHKEGGFKDIVTNKTGGAVVLLTGKAGVGKTLTAEVFAESMEKPLYNVQASQLGVKPSRFERQLMKVLRRAARWNAILLIDEADVYIHERRNDINQNAIVGVILRVLEYHSSILFMTTNRADIVDDAIASRCVARIDYEYPTPVQQIQIWKILRDSSQIKLDDKVIEEFVEKHSQYSGRDIKNLLKLANLKSSTDKKPITIETIEFVTQFNPTKFDKNVKESITE